MDVKTVEKAVRVLNDLLALEPVAVEKVFHAGVAVDALKVGALVALREVRVTPCRSVNELGLLGILNGIFADGPGRWPIGMLVDERGKITGFRVMPTGARRQQSRSARRGVGGKR